MKNNRPVNLPLSQVIAVNAKSPVAIASILHRVSGIILFLLVPLFLWLMQTSLSSEAGFDSVVDMIMSSVLLRFFLWVLVAGLLYHMIAGFKHLFADMGFAEELGSGRIAAWVSLALSVAAILWSFVWIML